VWRCRGGAVQSGIWLSGCWPLERRLEQLGGPMHGRWPSREHGGWMIPTERHGAIDRPGPRCSAPPAAGRISLDEATAAAAPATTSTPPRLATRSEPPGWACALHPHARMHMASTSHRPTRARRVHRARPCLPARWPWIAAWMGDPATVPRG
jgi:hypothetical protein